MVKYYYGIHWMYVNAGSSATSNDENMSGEPQWDDEDNIVSKLTCLGILGIEDPVRPEVSSTVYC